MVERVVIENIKQEEIDKSKIDCECMQSTRKELK